MEKALEWLDLKDGGEAVDGGALRSQFATSECSRRAWLPTRQPLSTGARDSPTLEWEGRVNHECWHVASIVTASIQESVRDMAIGNIRSNEKADCATVEQANVCHATKSDGQELAIKVYKTPMLVFKIGLLRLWSLLDCGEYRLVSSDTFFFLGATSYIPKTLDSVKNVEEDVIWITSGKDTGDIYYKTITWLHEALTKEDANAIEKPTNPGDNTKACGSESKSDTDADEDLEGNESASETESQAPVDKKAARKENQRKVKEERREAGKNKVPKAVKKRREKLAKAHETR